MTIYNWEKYDSQDEILDLTAGVAMRRPLFGSDTERGDVGWELMDGRRVERREPDGSQGCDTCGYGADRGCWFIGTPEKGA